MSLGRYLKLFQDWCCVLTGLIILRSLSINEPRDIHCVWSHLWSSLMSDNSPFQELQGKMQWTHSTRTWNNWCTGKVSSLFASGNFFLRFVGVCILSEKEHFWSYLLGMFWISNGYDFLKKIAWKKGSFTCFSWWERIWEQNTPLQNLTTFLMLSWKSLGYWGWGRFNKMMKHTRINLW